MPQQITKSRLPGCPATAHVERHHVIHWPYGGLTDTWNWNLASLCPFHHDGHHDGDFTIAGNADQPNALTFTTRLGQPIRLGPTFSTPSSPISTDSATGSPTPAPRPTNTRYRGPTGGRLDPSWVTFSEPRESANS